MTPKILFGGGVAVQLAGIVMSLIGDVSPQPYFAAGWVLIVMGWATVVERMK